AARGGVVRGRRLLERDLVVLLDRDDVDLGTHARVERRLGLLGRGRLLRRRGWRRRRGRLVTRHRWVCPIVLIGMGTAVLLGWLGSREQVPGRELARYDVMVDLAEDGAAQVTIDMDYAFGEQPGHGPFITLPLRQPYDDARDRVYRVSEITTSSPSGAPARHYLDETPWQVAVRVGDENRGDISGTHRYTISYRLDGILNPAAGDGTYDEWYWNVLGDGWEVPVRDVTVTVRGPADVLAAACYAGRTGATSSCGSARTAHDEARFTHPGVSPGEQLSVVVGWPAGTFPDARVR